MERFVIGHNADPSNWRQRLEKLTPRCLELFVPPRYCEGDGLLELQRALEQMAKHPEAQSLEFASCHFPWGESANKYSSYNLVDHQYFYSFSEIARTFSTFCSEIGLPPENSALNFHNLYELPRRMLEDWKRKGKLAAFRDTLLAHADAQTKTARAILDILDLPLTLVNENNPPIGDGDRMSIVDVFAEDASQRIAENLIHTCMDLSHFLMTQFYYDLLPEDRPSFPYLEMKSDAGPACRQTTDFEGYLATLNPLYFHVSDTKKPGMDRRFEGLPVGTGDTPWTDVLPALGRYASSNNATLFLIIEIKGGHATEGTHLCSALEHKLRGLIEDCFTSGFMDAISEKEALS